MNLLESLRSALDGIGANKLRASLTMSGIIIIMLKKEGKRLLQQYRSQQLTSASP